MTESVGVEMLPQCSNAGRRHNYAVKVLNLNNLIDSDQKQADEDNCIRYGCGSVAQSPIIFAVEVQL